VRDSQKADFAITVKESGLKKAWYG
ncbi:uncharacterized protein METZ01_LOCUS55395, partial [marine metagenome]